MPERVDGDRLWADVEQLAVLTDPALPYTRRSFSDLFLAGRDFLAQRMTDAGLTVAIDAGGNLVGRREGTEPGLAPIVTGSHSDTVPGGGRFDGIAGVLAGIEVARALRDAGVLLRHPLEIIDFLAEEPSGFGTSCIGSRALAGALSPAMLAATSPSGETLASGIGRVGGDATLLVAPLRGSGSVAGFFELHIEQGPVLESRGIPIGIVTDIVGIARFDLVVTGKADHAGTTPMPLRRDALVGAARIVDALYRDAGAVAKGAVYLVATTGRIEVAPNASNVVPARAALTVEIRSNDDGIRDAFAADFAARARALTDALGLGLELTEVSRSPATMCGAGIQQAIAAACRDLAQDFLAMPSGAGHDAVYMAKLGPSGMIFIPCLDGRSHAAEEWTEPAQLAAGAAVLRAAIERYDQA
jgi:beta-ureidopropionase / N-carbamoyl-L-amino-acid hydrolase